MACSTCHNPHGSISNVKALRTGSSVVESCTTCHTEMRGPVLWEHAPVRENCATCHDPHGSSNDRMLVVRQPMLCQRCHVATRHPVVDLRQQRHHGEQEQPDVRPLVHELPLQHSRFESSVGSVLTCDRTTIMRVLACAVCLADGGDGGRRTPSRRPRLHRPRPASPGPLRPSHQPRPRRTRAACSSRPGGSFRSAAASAASTATRPAGSVTKICATACSSPTPATRANGQTRASRSASPPTTSAGAISASSASSIARAASRWPGSGTRSRSSTASIRIPRTRRAGAGVLVLDDSTQRAIQNGQANAQRLRSDRAAVRSAKSVVISAW